MRYLNKIVFINSASVKYAEIELDGNVHLIGTQGVGKSTLLRAILFFYNANKIKLGIPKEKKSFDNYYFEYQNSYIIYEIVKNNIPFCVLAYKVNGKVAYRFFDAEYKRELFIDVNNRAFENWDKIRNAFGKDIHYSSIISSYEEFRKIIYGDNKGLKPNFRKYSLIESSQYENIPRTIQNVLLNSNLEAKFIKDTIINSINEEEFKIDIENYSKNHLRDFETQINDIKIWFHKNRKGQIIIRNQADKVIDNHRFLNFLKREKEDLAKELGCRMLFVENEKPIVTSNLQTQNFLLSELFKKKENLIVTHKNREQKIVSEIDYLKKELAKAKQKQFEYQTKSIQNIIQQVDKKENLINEQKALNEEQNLLTKNFANISEKYDALIAKIKNQQQEFYNLQNAEINKFNSLFSDEKNAIVEKTNILIHQIKQDNQAEKERFKNELTFIVDEENSIKRKKSELKYQLFFTDEIEQVETNLKELKESIFKANSAIKDSKNNSVTTTKEWELEGEKIKNNSEAKIDKEREETHKINKKITVIETKIQQSKSSLYGWLNENVTNWEQTIGKVIDEDSVLFNDELNPKLIDENGSTFFGISINLNALDTRVKTVNQYNDDIKELKTEINKHQKAIVKFNKEKEDSLLKLKKKFRKKLNEYKDIIEKNRYNVSQNEEKLKANIFDLEEWNKKAKTEKESIYKTLENELDKNASKKIKAQELLENIKKGIQRKITLKENEKVKEITILEKDKNEKIKAINISVENNKTASDVRIQNLKKEQTFELDTKGADTKRLTVIDNKLTEIVKFLDFISINEQLVFEYNKDKRELFDKVPEFKIEKLSLEKKQDVILNEHQNEKNKLDKKYTIQKQLVEKIKEKIAQFDADLKAFEDFKLSDAFISLQNEISNDVKIEKTLKTAKDIISDITKKHYKEIDKLNDLKQSINTFTGNFNENNLFSFNVKLNTDTDFKTFAVELKEFIEEDKIKEYEKRVNNLFASIIREIGRDTNNLNSKRGVIEKIIRKINTDFRSKNFIEAIKEMEMRTQESSNPIVKLLIKIQEFNDENSLVLGTSNLFTSSESESKNQKAVLLLKELIKAIEKYKNSTLTLSESFDLQFRIVENDNDSGWVEKLSNVGSNGTDILVKAMINISLLNVFKDDASKKSQDFKLHCMMDEIGTLHPTNQKGILRFANERNILLINGSPTSQNATDYKYTYKLAKEQSKTNSKKYITKINRLVKVTGKIL